VSTLSTILSRATKNRLLEKECVLHCRVYGGSRSILYVGGSQEAEFITVKKQRVKLYGNTEEDSYG